MRPEVLRTVAIGVCLVAALSLGAVARFGAVVASSVVAIAGVAAFGATLWRRPEWAPAVVVVGALAVPFTLGTGTSSELNSALVLPLLLLAMALLYRAPAVTGSVIRAEGALALPFGALALFLAAATMSFLVGLGRALPVGNAPLRAQVGQMLVLAAVAAAFLLPGLVRGDRRLELTVGVFLGVGSLLLVARLASPSMAWLASALPTGTDSSLVRTWLAAIAGGLLLFQRGRGLARRLALLLLIACVLVAGFRSFSWVSGWLPPLVALSTVVLLRLGRWVLLIAVPALLSLFYAAPSFARWILSENDYSYQTRGEAARSILELVERYPLLGSGPSNYYWHVLLFPIRGWRVPYSSHNQYLDVVAQFGAVGLLTFGLFFLALLWTVGRRWRREAGDFRHAFLAASLAGIAGTLAAGLLADWIVPFVYNTGFSAARGAVPAWLLMGCAVAVAGSESPSGSTSEPRSPA